MNKKRKKRGKPQSSAEQELRRLVRSISEVELLEMVAGAQQWFRKNAVEHGIIRRSLLEFFLSAIMWGLQIVILTPRSKNSTASCEAVDVLAEIRLWCFKNNQLCGIDGSLKYTQYRHGSMVI